MKKLILLISLLLIFAGCSDKEVQMEKVSFETSIHCEGCSKTISNKLTTTEGIKNFNIVVDTKIVSIEYNPTVIKKEKLRSIIVDLGYEAKEI